MTHSDLNQNMTGTTMILEVLEVTTLFFHISHDTVQLIQLCAGLGGLHLDSLLNIRFRYAEQNLG